LGVKLDTEPTPLYPPLRPPEGRDRPAVHSNSGRGARARSPGSRIPWTLDLSSEALSECRSAVSSRRQCTGCGERQDEPPAAILQRVADQHRRDGKQAQKSDWIHSCASIRLIK